MMMDTTEYIKELIEKGMNNAVQDESAEEQALIERRATILDKAKQRIPAELHSVLFVTRDKLFIYAPNCSPIEVFINHQGVTYSPSVCSSDEGEPYWRRYEYMALEDALYKASMEFQTWVEKSAEWEAKQAEAANRPDWLALASKMSETPEQVLGGIAVALCGILEYLQNKES